MLCGACGVELRVKEGGTVVRDDRAWLIQNLRCENPACVNFGIRTPVKQISHLLDAAAEPEERYVVCHDNVLAAVSGGGCYVPPGIERSTLDGGDAVICPDCAAAHFL